MTTADTTDWAALLDELAWLYGELDAADPNQLQRVPIGLTPLAERLGVSRGAIRNWMDGTEPRHMDGEMLICRWEIAAGKKREYRKMTRAGMSARRSGMG